MMNEPVDKKLELKKRITVLYDLAYDDGFKAGMQRAVEMNKVAAYINEEDGLVCAKCFKPFADTNKPVAYVNNMCNDSIDWKVDPMDLEEGTPLYTHPVKELTDEEIKAVWHKVWHDEEGTILDFGKAILRKAQEK